MGSPQFHTHSKLGRTVSLVLCLIQPSNDLSPLPQHLEILGCVQDPSSWPIS